MAKCSKFHYPFSSSHMFGNLIICRHHSSIISLNFKPHRTELSKESQILSLCRSGSLFEAFRVLNSSNPEDLTAKKPLLYASLLQTATKVRSFSHGLQLHAHITKLGLKVDRLVGNSLLALYFKLGPDFDDASKLFDRLIVRDVISWTSMICGYIRVGKPKISVDVYLDMLGCGIEPNAYTLSAVIKGSSDIGDVNLGRCFQGTVLKAGFDSNCVIASALIDMYGKTHELGEALKVFDELIEPDSVCWTTMISALTRNDQFKGALSVFYLRHKDSGVVLDEFTYGSVLSACGNIGLYKQGKQMHCKLIIEGFCGHLIVESSLIDMYAKCGAMKDARCVFDGMPRKNSVSWSALLGGYCHNGDFRSVIQLFRMMDYSDLYSYGTVLRACAGLAAVKHGKEVHCQYVRKCGGQGNVIIESALVDLYAKSGCINFAEHVFAQMVIKNLITWNSMICGFAQHGRGVEAIELYNLMVEQGIKPDYISFVGVLFACSHAGLVEQGRKYFSSMTDEYEIKPGIEHYNCMVDLLGRAGSIQEAEHLIEKADCKGSASLWPALLGACTTSRNSDAVERVAKKMMEIDPFNHLSYVHLTNAYKAVGRWNDALSMRKLMKDRGVEKTPGKSWTDSTKQLIVP